MDNEGRAGEEKFELQQALLMGIKGVFSSEPVQFSLASDTHTTLNLGSTLPW